MCRRVRDMKQRCFLSRWGLIIILIAHFLLSPEKESCRYTHSWNKRVTFFWSNGFRNSSLEFFSTLVLSCRGNVENGGAPRSWLGLWCSLEEAPWRPLNFVRGRFFWIFWRHEWLDSFLGHKVSMTKVRVTSWGRYRGDIYLLLLCRKESIYLKNTRHFLMGNK